MEKKYPIGGYAPGNYTCKCTTCNEHFQGDKRAVQCEPCAIEAKERFDSLDPNEQELLIKRNAMIANFMFSGPLTPERDLVYRIVEQWGNAIEMSNMEGWLKEYAAKQAAPQGAVWVKGAKGFPVKKLVVAKMFISYLNKEVIGSASSATGEMIVFDWGESAVFLTIDHEELNNLTWLDESVAPAKESNEIELSAFFQEGAECWKLEYEMCRKLLQELVDLKNIKETEGKTEDYNLRQPVAWINAKKFLEKFQHINW